MQLPPLKSLPYFIAVAKHKHFAQAASELNLTAGAISQQIKQLEQYLGTTLFNRDTKHVELTHNGIRYYKEIEAALIHIEQATSQIKPLNQDTVQLRIFSTLAVQWLIPQLNDLYLKYPDINLNMMTSTELKTHDVDNADLSIQLGLENPTNKAVKLWQNQLVLVYNPQIITADQLKNSPAIVVNHPIREQDWQTFCNATHLTIPSKKISVATTIHAIQAVENGLGSFVTHLPLVYTLIQSKRLSIWQQPLPLSQYYYLVDNQPHRHTINKRIVHDWLVAHAQTYLQY
ncbi:LysR family transcriptional regulator [Cysteiniphilum halobium]|uniref:LysR family transcriptional regulator n=1 Tax=Cysteiniphilum halobium TaxID=2219059 RepID=UPI0013C2C707|nr:LysR family transcriptional regulator [Cysteiniphilum halobium]